MNNMTDGHPNNRDNLPYVSVIIPTYHDWNRLQICLDLLDKQTYPKTMFEILVVNNDPSDTPLNNLVVPENCKLLEEAKPGSYAARNKALSYARGDIIAFTDSDCRPQADWLEIAVNYFNTNPDCERIGGNIKLFSNNEKLNWFEIYEVVFAFPQRNFVNAKGMAATANMITKKHVFDKVGMFNSNLMSGGDGEWGKRAFKSGSRIEYLSNCIVYHPTRNDIKNIKLKSKRLAGGHLTLAQNQSRLAVAKLITKNFIPPINAAKYIFKDTEYSVKYKSIALVMSYYLKLYSNIEIVKLLTTDKVIERE